MKTLILLFLLLPTIAQAKHDHPEKWYQERLCSEYNGKVEVVLVDKNRADCVTNTHAIEFDYGDKWAESIGQALYYAIYTQNRASIVMILEEESERKYWKRLKVIINHFRLPIDIWTTGVASKISDNLEHPYPK
jgi:hypothetical protein